MRKFPTVFMRGGTSKGIMFLEQDLPVRKEWDDIFVQCMGSPDPKQIDGVGGCVSSNNKIVVVRKSERPGVDVDYIVGQSIVGQSKIDYKSNCGNMTSATAPFAIEMGLVNHLAEPTTIVHMFNLNTNKYIDVEVPIKNGQFNNDGQCAIAGVDGTAGELKVNFLDPAGSKTGKLFPTGNVQDTFEISGFGKIRATILDVSNPIVLVRAEDIGAVGTEMPTEVDQNKTISAILEAIRGSACVRMGFAADLNDATNNSPAVPKVGFFTKPANYVDIAGKNVQACEMDICARVISVFKCHKACPLTSASAIAVARAIPGTLLYEELGAPTAGKHAVRIGHPSGVMTMFPYMDDPAKRDVNTIQISGVAVQRTARRIMDGTIYVKN
ncbi:MAG: 2-methylaconitate cis-trans isomerase PrpF family protein [Lawsonibacter sp.]